MGIEEAPPQEPQIVPSPGRETRPRPKDAEEPAAQPDEPPPATETTAEPQAQSSVEAPSSVEVGYGHIKDAWSTTLREVGKRSKRVAAFLNPSRPVKYDGDDLVVQVQSDFHVGEMGQTRNRDMLVEALHASLGIRPTLSFVAQGAVPTQSQEAPDEAADYSGREMREEDPIELVRKGLGAEVVEER